MSEGKPFIKSGRLFDCENAFYRNEELTKLFLDSMKEAMKWHISHCADYKSFLDENGIIDFNEIDNVEQIPPLLVDVFKKYSFVSVPEKQIRYEIPYEKNDKLLLDVRSYKRLLKIYENIFSILNLVNHNQKYNYICFTQDKKYTLNSNYSFYYDLLTNLTAHRSVYYAIRFNKKINSFYFDVEETSKKLIDFSCHSEPIRIIGEYDYIFQILKWFEKNNITLKLPRNTNVFIIEDDIKINFKLDFIKGLCENLFDISQDNIKKIFILPEQGIPYVSCKYGRFHIPIYSEAFALDPETLLPVDNGKQGLLALLTPYLSSYPGISLLTTYKSVFTTDCSCGLSGKSFEIL